MKVIPGREHALVEEEICPTPHPAIQNRKSKIGLPTVQCVTSVTLETKTSALDLDEFDGLLSWG